MYEDVKKFDQPLLVINFDGDVCLLPHEATGTFVNSASPDKELIRIEADHFAFSLSGDREKGIHETAEAMLIWLRKYFPTRC